MCDQMERADSIIQYVNSILQAKDQKLSTLVAVLTAFAEALERDGEDILKKAAVKLCIHEPLLSVLKKPCQFWKGAKHTLMATGNDGERQNIDTDRSTSSQDKKSQLIYPHNEPSFHPLLYTQALRCLYSICTLHQKHLRKVIDEAFLKTIFRFLRINPSLSSDGSSHFYQYSPTFMSVFKTITSSYGEVKVCHTQEVEVDRTTHHRLIDELSFYEPDYFEHLCQGMALEPSCYVLKFESQGKELYVAEELMSHNLAWKTSQRVKKKEERNEGETTAKIKMKRKTNEKEPEEDNWIKAKVTHVLHGNYFWMQVGEEQISRAHEISQALKSTRLNRIKPKRMSCVAVKIVKHKDSYIVRAKITVVTSRNVTALDIDTGCSYKVPLYSVFELPNEFCETQIPPQATLAQLHGVLPVPLDVRAVELAAGTLGQICRYNIMASNLVRESDLMLELPDLMVAPDPDIASQSLRLAANLLMKIRSRCSSMWLNMIIAALEALNKCVQRTVDDKIDKGHWDSNSLSEIPRAKSPNSQESNSSPVSGNIGKHHHAHFDFHEIPKSLSVRSPKNDKDLGNASMLGRGITLSPSLSPGQDLRKSANEKYRHGEQDIDIPNKNPFEVGQSDDAEKDVCGRLSTMARTLPTPSNSSKSPSDEGKISKARNRNLIMSCLLFLINRLYMSKEAKNFFYSLRGLEIVMRSYLLYYKNQCIRISSIQVLCNFVHVTQSTKNENLSKERRKQEIARHEAGAAALSESLSSSSSSSLSSLSSSRLSLSSSHDKFPTQELPRLPTSYGKKPVYMAVGYEENSDEDSPCSEAGSFDEDILSNCLKSTAGASEIRGPGTEEDEDIEGRANVRDVYVKGSIVAFRADSRHEFYQTTKLSAESVSVIVCGMLNSGHEGKIYLGIEENGEVQGQVLSHETRDELRLGIDQIMMTRLVPSVFHSQFHMRFIPVVELIMTEDGGQKTAPCDGLYVVEIVCKPVPRVLYCCNGGRCYYRMGAKTVPLGPKDIRHMIVIEEEEWHKDQIMALKKELAELKKTEAQLQSRLTSTH